MNQSILVARELATARADHEQDMAYHLENIGDRPWANLIDAMVGIEMAREAQRILADYHSLTDLGVEQNEAASRASASSMRRCRSDEQPQDYQTGTRIARTVQASARGRILSTFMDLMRRESRQHATGVEM